MIFCFDDFCNRNENNSYKIKKFDDSDYLAERLSISCDVSATTRDVVYFLENEIKKGELKKIDSGMLDGCEYEMFEFKNNLHYEIFGCDCEFNLKIYNFNSDVSFDVDNIAKHNNFGANIGTHMNIISGVSHLDFLINGKIIALDGKISLWSSSTISHELKHAYTLVKIYDGVPSLRAIDKVKSLEKWREIYSSATKYMERYSNFNDFQKIIDRGFYVLMYTIYSCDITEIASFAQQAYESCRVCKNKNDVLNKMKKSDLHNMIEVFKMSLKILTDDRIQEMYMKNKMDIQPTVIQLMKLIERRNKKAKATYGRVLALLYDELDENDGHILIDVK